jgi:hypothetical protein
MSKRNIYLIMGLLLISGSVFGYEFSSYSNRNIVIDASSLAGNLIPAADDQYVLGSTTARWKSLQLGPGTLFIEDQESGKQAQITVKAGALQINGASSLKIGSAQLTAKGLVFPDGTLQTTAQLVGPKGEKGDTGMSGGPQGLPGPSGTSGYEPKVICIDSIDKKMIFSSCAAAGISGVEFEVLVESNE